MRGVVPGLGLALMGCGYSMVATKLPANVHRVVLIPFAEDAAAGVSGDIAQELATLLAASGVELSGDEVAADGVLSGRILEASASGSPVSDPANRISSYSLVLRVRMNLVRRKKELWSSEITSRDDFLPDLDPHATLITEAHRREALRRAARAAARELFDRLVLADVWKS